MRVLVIDDNGGMRRAVGRLLASMDAVLSGSSREALDRLLGGEQFDVVLCDIMMPDPNGIDLYRQAIRSRPELSRRFVFMSGGSFIPGTLEFIQATGCICLQKPFTGPALLAVLRDMG